MKILLLTNYSGAWPYLPELIEELRSQGIHVDLFDVGDLALRKADGSIRPLMPRFFNILQMFTVFRVILRVLAVRKLSKSLATPYDILNVHYISPDYLFLTRQFRKLARKVILSVWGSDFYRISGVVRQKEHRLYASADAITFLNPRTLQDFVAQFPGTAEKGHIVRFGLGSIRVISDIQLQETVQESRHRLGIPADAVVITCGYNAHQAQQHRKMLSSLFAVRDKLPPNIHLVLPMTYPRQDAYVQEIEKYLQESGVGYSLFRSMMQPEDVARIRRSTDIAVNMQTTDQLSASIQEHLFAGNIVIVASWLPYDIYQKLGITYFRAEDFGDLGDKLLDVTRRFSELRDRCSSNREIVFAFSSWHNNIDSWISLYRSVLDSDVPVQAGS